MTATLKLSRHALLTMLLLASLCVVFGAQAAAN
jgi:hypothetical protein